MAAAKYNAGRDFISSTKVNYFHYALNRLTGFLLHPSIKLNETSRVADFGTQTVIWPIHLSETVPEGITIDGFDISNKFWPSPAWLPSNVHLQIQDVYEPFPAELEGKYDVVHIRLFLYQSKEKTTLMLENAFKLLKPGGYVQWIEHDKTNLQVVKTLEDANTTAVDAMIELNHNPFPNHNYRWVNEIAPTIASLGHEVITDDRMVNRPALLTQLSDLHMLAMLDVPAGLSPMIDGFKEKHFEELAEESRAGVAMLDTFICVVGRKRSL